MSKNTLLEQQKPADSYWSRLPVRDELIPSPSGEKLGTFLDHVRGCPQCSSCESGLCGEGYRLMRLARLA